MVPSRVRETDLYSDPTRQREIGFEVKDKVADILITSVIMQE